MPEFRLHQRVCRVVWRDGVPGIEVQQVTRVTARTMDVNGVRDHGGDWFASWNQAVAAEFTRLFQDQTFGIAEKKGRSIWWTIQRLNRLKRMTKKIQNRR